jgi:murein DD-endopeptidase MepM/ murein hydrolase activator NlpD
MRTFRILFAGWVIGAAVIVLLTLLQPRAQARAADVERRRPAPADVTASGAVTPLPITEAAARDAAGISRRGTSAFSEAVIIPVAGMSPSDLRDNYLQMRGGGTRTHGAIDIMAPRGTPVVAAVDGTVRKLFNSAAGGLTVYQFDQSEMHVYYYAHLDRYDPVVREGLFVAKGTVIGYVGTTGNAAPDAPHLHFAIQVLPPTKEWWKGTPINPYPVLTATPVASGLP